MGGMLGGRPLRGGQALAGADVLLTSFLVSQAAIFCVDWAIGGPFRDPANNLVAMRAIPPESLLPRMAPPAALRRRPWPRCPGPAFMGLACPGRAPARADPVRKEQPDGEPAGFSRAHPSWLPILVAGAAHGLAGAFLSLGANGTAVRGISGGLGWSAIGVALIAGNEPLARAIRRRPFRVA